MARVAIEPLMKHARILNTTLVLHHVRVLYQVHTVARVLLTQEVVLCGLHPHLELARVGVLEKLLDHPVSQQLAYDNIPTQLTRLVPRRQHRRQSQHNILFTAELLSRYPQRINTLT